MSKTSCIQHPANTPLLMIRADYLILCDGNACAAALLNEFEQFENHALNEQGRDTSEWAKPGTEAPDPERWFYWTRKDIARELFHVYSAYQMDKALALLFEKGFINRREYGVDKMDHRYQYRFHVATIQAAINGLASVSPDVLKSKQRVSKSEQRCSENATLSTSLRVSTKQEKETTSDAANATPGTQPVPEPKAVRQRNPLFDAVAREVFEMADGEVENAVGGRIGPLAAWLAGKSDGPKGRKLGFISRPAEPAHISAFVRDWKRKNPNASVPKDIAKFVEAWRAFASSRQRRENVMASAFLSEAEMNAMRPDGTEYLVTYAQ